MTSTTSDDGPVGEKELAKIERIVNYLAQVVKLSSEVSLKVAAEQALKFDLITLGTQAGDLSQAFREVCVKGEPEEAYEEFEDTDDDAEDFEDEVEADDEYEDDSEDEYEDDEDSSEDDDEYEDEEEEDDGEWTDEDDSEDEWDDDDDEYED